MEHPFEATFDEIQSDPERYVSAVFSNLVSEFLILPKGVGFVDYPTFEATYETLKQFTGGFTNLDSDEILSVAVRHPISLIVLRSMLGFTPPEWAYVTTQRTGTEVTQSFVRSLDRKARINPHIALKPEGATFHRIRAL